VASIAFAVPSRVLAGWKNMLASIGRRGDRTGLHPWVPEIRQNFLGMNLTFAQRSQIVSDRFLFIQPHLAGIGTNETFIEHSTGKLVKVFVFEST